MLSKEAVNDFMKIYKLTYGIEISKSEAMQQGTRLIELIRIIYRSIPIEGLKTYRKEVITYGNNR